MKRTHLIAAALVATWFATPASADVINGRVYWDEPRVGVNAMTPWETVGAMGDDTFFRGNNAYLARDAEAQRQAGYGMTRMRSGYGVGHNVTEPAPRERLR